MMSILQILLNGEIELANGYKVKEFSEDNGSTTRNRLTSDGVCESRLG